MPGDILVVDDEPSMLDLLKKIFEDEGYNVVTASNAYEAIKATHKNNFYVIYLDLNMPDTNGVELCRKIREKNQFAWITAITGARSLFEINECREAGFDDYYTKPFDIEVILGNTEKAFARIERWKLSK
ncbi:MAG: response regulator receiver protein [uncultured bacterium]|nr:MAG: response regulator receiver protein [uncultured bacterium]